MFSWPPADPCDEFGRLLPVSEVWLRARFIGLFGDVRVRDAGRGGAVFEVRVDDRNANFALGGNGTASGDGVWGALAGVPTEKDG